MMKNQANLWMILCLIFMPTLLVHAIEPPSTQPQSGAKLPRILDRVSCSSLCQAKQPLDVALKRIAGIGYKNVDLAALSWCPHVSPPALVADFNKEATRVESALAASHMRVSNCTFDAMEQRPFDEYEKQFDALVRFAARSKAGLINIMAPGVKANRPDAVAKLRKLEAIASRSHIMLTLETHTNQITERPADAAWLCDQVPGLGLTLDPSHYYAGPNQGASFDQLYPLTRGTGLRAGGMNWATVQLPWGEGPIDFAAIIRSLEKAGYKGFYETEYIEGFNRVDALRETRRFREWMETTFGG
jgi:sugar phosphate isomerase/epimerase